MFLNGTFEAYVVTGAVEPKKSWYRENSDSYMHTDAKQKIFLTVILFHQSLQLEVYHEIIVCYANECNLLFCAICKNSEPMAHISLNFY